MTPMFPLLITDSVRETARPRLRVLCAWCEEVPTPDAAQQVSHGICRECAVRFFGIDPKQVAANQA